MPDPTLAIILKLAAGLIGWVAFRLESYGTRIVRLEEKLQNGIVTSVAELRKEHAVLRKLMEDHANQEEERIMELVAKAKRQQHRHHRKDMEDA